MADAQFDLSDLQAPAHNDEGGYHTFVVRHASVGTAAPVYEWELPLGPLRLRGLTQIDPATSESDIQLYGKLPFLPEFRLAAAKGNLKDGIATSVDTAVAKGTLTQYLKNSHEVWVKFDLTVLGKKWQGDTRLFNV